jgi:AcrR family transcriptional regulator
MNDQPKRGRPLASEEQISAMRARITDAARALFLGEGYRAVSMRRIATAVGCSPMTLYGYFPAKIDLLGQLWKDVFTRLFTDLDRIGRDGPAPFSALKLVSCAYVRYWVDHPDHYRMVFMSEGVSQPEVSLFATDGEITHHYALFYTLITNACRIEQAALIPLGECLICSLNGIAHNLITMSGYPWSSPEKLAETLVDGLFANFLACNA